MLLVSGFIWYHLVNIFQQNNAVSLASRQIRHLLTPRASAVKLAPICYMRRASASVCQRGWSWKPDDVNGAKAPTAPVTAAHSGLQLETVVAECKMWATMKINQSWNGDCAYVREHRQQLLFTSCWAEREPLPSHHRFLGATAKLKQTAL